MGGDADDVAEKRRASEVYGEREEFCGTGSHGWTRFYIRTLCNGSRVVLFRLVYFAVTVSGISGIDFMKT